MKKLINLILVIGLMASCVNEPQAYFSYKAGDGFPNEEIKFYNKSIDAENFLWDFGDGSISTEENPAHTYLKAGSYEVVLKASNKKYTSEASDIIDLKDPYIYQIYNGYFYSIDNIKTCYKLSDGTLEIIKSHGDLQGKYYTDQTKTKYPCINIIFSYYGEVLLINKNYYLKNNAINTIQISGELYVTVISGKNGNKNQGKRITINELLSNK